MKQHRSIALFCALGSLLLLCSACKESGKDDPLSESKETPPVPEFSYTERTGGTAVLLEDAVLTDCYSYTYRNANDYATYLWENYEFELSLSAGDIFLVLKEEGETSRVVVPYGDVPWLYGYVPSALLSTDAGEIGNGNQAIIIDCNCYDSAGGSIVQTGSARVAILARDGDWANVQELGTGADPYWVRSGDLSFDFDTTMMDLPD